MIENKAITYGLLAHVRNSGDLMKGPIDVFVPLIKRTLHQLNSKGVFKGESLLEIQSEANSMYSIDFPIPVLKIILIQIANEINTSEEQKFVLHSDSSFILKSFYFEDFEEQIQDIKRETESLEKIFQEFCTLHNVEPSKSTSIFDFIDKNKLSISRYLSNTTAPNGHEYCIEAEFVEFFKKVPNVFDIVRRLYLGSIISSFLEYKTENIQQDIELLFDTNFIISLIDLNTPESTHTCRKLIEVGKNLNFKFTILSDTVEEAKSLIRKKAETLDHSFLSRRINPEDIYNACERRNLSQNDLERIADNLEDTLSSFGITINIYTEALKTKAQNSRELDGFLKIRNSRISALHDAIAMIYVKEKRTKKIREFEKVNCWFVNNSTSHEIYDVREEERTTFEYQKETIKVDELLNILWLSQPRINTSIDNEDLIDIGLSSIVAYTLNESLPKANIIRDLEKNIEKYRGEEISDKDILNIATRISKKQIKNIAELNNIAETNKSEFISKLKIEAELQQKIEDERVEKFDELLGKFQEQLINLQKAKSVFQSKESRLAKREEEIENSILNDQSTIDSLKIALENEKLGKQKLESQIKETRRQVYIDLKVKKWRNNSWIKCSICVILIALSITYIFYLSDWKISKFKSTIEIYKSNIIIASLTTFFLFLFTFYFARELREKYINNSNIKAFKDMLKIPDDLK
jgi:hypothetical protein